MGVLSEEGQLASYGTIWPRLGMEQQGKAREVGAAPSPQRGSSQPACLSLPFPDTPSRNPSKRHYICFEDIIKREEDIIKWESGDLVPILTQQKP